MTEKVSSPYYIYKIERDFLSLLYYDCDSSKETTPVWKVHYKPRYVNALSNSIYNDWTHLKTFHQDEKQEAIDYVTDKINKDINTAKRLEEERRMREESRIIFD